MAAYMLKPIKQSELFDAIMLALGVAVPEDEHATPFAQRTSRLGPLRVLLAEDSLVNQKLAVGLLTKWGHSVVVANNGREAVGALESQPFDLVLMDVQMPEMDGLEATESIRSREKRSGRHIPIVAMTAHAMKGDRERCLAAGMDDYVSKPIRARQLLETMEGVLGTRASDECQSEEGVAGNEAAGRPQPRLPSSGEGIVDWAAALNSVQGDHGLLKAVVETFLQECPELRATMRRALSEGDAASLRRAAHTLKGSSEYVGAKRAFEKAFELEKMAERGKLDGAEELLDALEGEVTRLAPVLLDYVGGLSKVKP